MADSDIIINSSNSNSDLRHSVLWFSAKTSRRNRINSYREGQINALDRVQKAVVKFAHHTNNPNLENLASRGKLSHICALFKAYSGEPAWKVIGDRLQRPHYLSRVDHERKIRSRRQRTDIRKYSFVNRTIQHWNQLPAQVLGTLSCKPIIFKRG